MKINKAYKIKLYPNKIQQEIIDKTIGCSRFIYNQMLNERIKLYDELKNDKDKLYKHKYKTEKEYKKEYPFLEEASSRGLQQSRGDLETAYINFFKGIKKNKKIGFPKFKSKHKSKWSYREPQINYKDKQPNTIEIKDNKIKLNKLKWINFRGLSKKFKGIIKNVTIIKNRNNTYEASILVEQEREIRIRKSNDIVGIDLGLKNFIVCSNGNFIKGIKEKLVKIEKEIKKQQKYLSKKQKGSKGKEKCRLKLAKLYTYKTNFQNHFFWHLINKLCNENQVISIENLNVSGMIKNKHLSHSIFYSNWSNFINKLEQKAKEYGTEVYKVDRFFPSSKLCSNCGKIKNNLKLCDRVYKCDCGYEIDRDLNASLNIRNESLKHLSLESSDYRHGEIVKPKEIIYNFEGDFSEVLI